MQVTIITPEHTAYSGDAESVTIPTLAGEITVLAHHIPLVGTLVAGTIIIRAKDGEQYFAVSRGVVEVDGVSVRILSDIADRAENLQEDVIAKAMADAEKLKSERREDTEGFAEATAIMERELARFKSLRRHRTRSRPPIPPSSRSDS